MKYDILESKKLRNKENVNYRGCKRIQVTVYKNFL